MEHRFQVTVDGREIDVTHLQIGTVAWVVTDTEALVSIRPGFDFEDVTVRPLARGVEPTVGDGKVVIRVAPGPVGPGREGKRESAPARAGTAIDDEARSTYPAYLSVEFDGKLRDPLFLFIDRREAPPPADDQTVIRLEGGRVHEIPHLRLESGQTLYLEEGAVLRGNVIAEEARGIAIRGRGVIDGSIFTHDVSERQRLVHLVACDDVVIEGIAILDGRNWQIMPCGCDGVTIRDVKIVSDWRSDDGIDLVGCRDVLVERCFIRTRDDCVAIKGFDTYHPRGGKPISNILVRRSVFWNAEWGNALEIGYETSVDSISAVTFRDCDVIHCEAERFGSGGTLTIHNGDRAVVHDVLYEDIRVEDAQEKLVDFKVCFDRYSRDEARGQIRGVTLRNVAVTGGGFPLSILQGFGREHLVEQVRFENVAIHGERMTSAGQMRMITEKARDVEFG